MTNETIWIKAKPVEAGGKINRLTVGVSHFKGLGYLRRVQPGEFNERTGMVIVEMMSGTSIIIQEADKPNKRTLAKLFAGVQAEIEAKSGPAWDHVVQIGIDNHAVPEGIDP